MTILLDEHHKVFVLGPNPRLCKDAIKLYSPFEFSRMPAILCEIHDVHRMRGLERLHVIELTSPRDWTWMNSIDRGMLRELRQRAREQYHLMQGREASIGNMWIELNLP